MNILFFEDVITFGGARKSTVEFAKNLIDLGHKAAIMDMHGVCVPFLKSCQENSIPIYVVDKEHKQKLITNTHNLLKKILNYIWFFFYSIRVNKRILELIYDITPDYIIVNNSQMLSYFLRKKPCCKIALFARGWFIPQQISFFDRLLYTHYVDKYLCVSEATRHAVYCSRLSGLKEIMVVHNYIDEKKYEIIPKANIDNTNNCPIILVSGGFLPTKGLHVAVDIAKVLQEKHVDFKMVITGIIYAAKQSQQYYNKIVEKIAALNLEQNVTLVVNQTDVISYFKSADIFIHPSSTEGLPRVVMEAMIMRIPVIANAVGGVTDYIINGYTGFIPRYNNVTDYVEYIELIMNNTELYREITENAYRLVSKCYTKKNQIDSFIKSLQ